MPDVQFINKDLTGEAFQRGQKEHEEMRRLENADFEARRVRDQAAGVDKAIRESIGSIYAKPKTSPEPAPAAAPAAAPVGTQAQAPATTPMPDIYPPNPAETGSTLPQAASRPVSLSPPAATPTAAPAAAPAPAPAPTSAISSVTPRPAPAARPQAGADGMIQRLASTPGGGSAAMTLHSSNVTAQQKAHDESRADRDKGTDLFVKAFEAGQPDVARMVAQQYSLNIPDQMFSNKSFVNEMTKMANFAARMKLEGDDAANFIHEGLRTWQAGESQEQTGMRYTNALGKVTGKTQVVETAGGILNVPKSGGAAATPILMPGTNKPAMPAPKTVVHVSNDGEKATSNMKDVDAMVKAGVAKDQKEAWQMIRTAKTDPLAKEKLARNLMSSAKDRAGRPIYKTIQEAMTAIDAADTAPPAAAPSAAPNEPAAAPAPKAQRTSTALPIGKDGRPDAAKLVNGTDYTFTTKDGKTVSGKWDAASKRFK